MLKVNDLFTCLADKMNLHQREGGTNKFLVATKHHASVLLNKTRQQQAQQFSQSPVVISKRLLGFYLQRVVFVTHFIDVFLHKQEHSWDGFHNLSGNTHILVVFFLFEVGCFDVHSLHVPESILTTDLVNPDLRTSSRVIHRLQRLGRKYLVCVVTMSIINPSGGQTTV